MSKDYIHICEATLWDNLKRNANKTLRELEDIKNSSEVLNEFKPKLFPEKIQKLLENIGKEFFKIFLYESLKNELGSDVSKWEENGIEKKIENFKFYFWPGYTTLNKERIHIRGSRKNNHSDDRFFTGIGNNKIALKEKRALKNYFERSNREERLVFDFDRKFWIKNIPSTIAFDAVLSQYYINKEFGQGTFTVPSTNFWKSSQKRKSNSIEFITMPLSTDYSEFRILEVSVGNSKIEVGNNKIFIEISNEYLTKSGNQLYEYLERDRIKIAWLRDSDKKDYVEWPFADNSRKHFSSQLGAYSYWISETLDNDTFCILDYNDIRKEFTSDGLSSIAVNVVPFNKFKKKYFQPEKLHEIYYKYWNTIFLESYSEEVDLGTAMFLTSERYSSEFLMKSSNWLRWIYNELRLIEATAKEEIETEEEDFGKLSHNTKLLFPYLRDIITSMNSENMDSQKVILTSELRDLENIITASFYSNNIDIYKEHYPQEKTNLEKCITKVLNNISFDIVVNDGQIIKLLADDEFLDCIKSALINKSNPLFNLNIKANSFVFGNEGVLLVILKDLIGNAVRRSTDEMEPGTPYPEVIIKTSQDEKDYISLEITNGLIIDSDALYIWENGEIPKESSLSLSFGLKIAHSFCNAFNIKKSIKQMKKLGTRHSS